jgi:hypothetical protein
MSVADGLHWKQEVGGASPPILTTIFTLSGVIGSHSRLKICRFKKREGSSPSLSTHHPNITKKLLREIVFGIHITKYRYNFLLFKNLNASRNICMKALGCYKNQAGLNSTSLMFRQKCQEQALVFRKE